LLLRGAIDDRGGGRRSSSDSLDEMESKLSRRRRPPPPGMPIAAERDGDGPHESSDGPRERPGMSRGCELPAFE
jgi:hypothetical protein